MTSPDSVEIALLRADSAVVTCPFCYNRGPTITSTRAGVLTYLACVCLALAGCCMGCCLIPCCVAPFLDVRHQCAECKRVLATYERL